MTTQLKNQSNQSLIQSLNNSNKQSKNLSTLSNYNNQQIKPKSPRKSTKKQLQKSYIEKAFQNIQKGCYDQKTGKLKIDGQFGDYKMKLFRKKDRTSHYNDPISIFKDKQFSQKIWDYALSHINKNEQNLEYKANQNQIMSPVDKKLANRQQRARLGLKRNQSITSPTLKSYLFEKQKSESKILSKSQKDLQLTSKINDILSKSRDYYLYQPVENQQNQQENNKLKRGIEQQLRQKQGHLFYRSIPQYMAQKWFKTLDNSTADGNKVIPYVQQKQPPKPPQKPRNKRTHLFRFMENNCSFNFLAKNNSMPIH